MSSSNSNSIVDQASAVGNNLLNKANSVSQTQTGKTVEEHGATLTQSATQFASHVGDYAKGVLGMAAEKAGQAKEAADKTELPGSSNQTLGGLVNESRNLFGKVLESASSVIEQKTPATEGAGINAYVGQARNTIASGLRKAEDIVVGHPSSGNTTGSGEGSSDERIEPMTSNLMEGAKYNSVTPGQAATPDTSVAGQGGQKPSF